MPSRKRPAPGASPIPQQQPQLPQTAPYNPMGESSQPVEDQIMNWGYNTGISQQYPDPSSFGVNVYGSAVNGSIAPPNGPQIAPVPATSSQLVRRNANQQLATRGRSLAPGGWEFGNQNGQGWEDVNDDEADLEVRALQAKKEAQEKRKQIPPFVQKLSSFLDESRNTELIRWSDDGNSFIVLDEDEFARTLIPELFKHNNYASFVRQLNMYGFHKKVGLADNSMKASEKKTKAPSEYFNKYFKRGRSELLWLIQKPKNVPSREKRKRDDDKKGDSDDEGRKYAEGIEGSQLPVDGGGGNQELTTIPKSELSKLRSELQLLQQQQKYISTIIHQIKRQNDQLYQQASAFQTLHDRHESSITAILTFLATFYNRSVEGHGPANLQDIFSHVLPPQNQPQHGNVVDVGDLPDIQVSPNQMRRRQPLALLPAPATKEQSTTPISAVRSSTLSPKPRNNQNLPIFRPSPHGQAPTPASRNLAPNNQTRPFSAPSNTPSPRVSVEDEINTPTAGPEEIMSVINTANNATATSPNQQPFDFDTALHQIGNNRLTQQERNNVLSAMASSHGPNGAMNALAAPLPHPMPALDETVARRQLEVLEQLHRDQSRRIGELASTLQPLSPTGTIPGLAGGGGSGGSVGGGEEVFGNVPSEFDLDHWINDPGDPAAVGDNNFDYFSDANAQHQAGNMNGGLDFSMPIDEEAYNFGFDGTADMQHGGGVVDPLFGDESGDALRSQKDDANRIETLSSAGTSPVSKAEDFGKEDDVETTTSSKKRRKVGR